MTYRYEPGTWGAFLFDGEPWPDGSTADDLGPGERAAIEATLRARAGGRFPHEVPALEPEVDLDERDGCLHNVVAHPLLVLAPRVGRWLHHLTPPVVPSLRSRLAARRR